MAADPNQLIAALLGTGGITGGSFTQGLQNTAQAQQNTQQAAMAPLQQQAAQQGLQLGQQQIASNDAATAKAAAYQNWEAAYSANPTSKMLGQGIAAFPEQAKALKDSYDALTQDAQQSRTLQFNQLYNAAKGGRSDLVAQNMASIIAAEKAAGTDTSDVEKAQQDVANGDPDALKSVLALAQAHLAITNPDFAKAIGVTDHASRFAQLGSGGIYNQETGEIVKAPDTSPDSKFITLKNADGSEYVVQVGGGDQGSSGGGAAGGSGGPAAGGDVSRLINSDAGGGQVPAGVKTLGQFVGWGRSKNAAGAKSSSAGTYQINGTTMAEFGPKALGSDWKSAPFNADTQDKVGEAIFDWAKTQPNPALALSRRWVSLTPGKAAQLVGGSWDQAKGVIAQGETGGGPGASAVSGAGDASGQGMGRVVYGQRSGAGSGVDDSVVGPAYAATLSPGRRNLVQAIVDGRAPAPRPGSRFGEALAEDVARVDPTADATTLPIRQKVRTEFNASGKQGQAMQAYNRFAAHLNSAYALHQQLGGANLGPLSGIAASASQSFSPKLVNQYNTEIEGLQGEFQKLTKLGVANEGEANRLIAAAKPNQSADGRLGALQGMGELVAGAYQPAVQSWQAAFPGKPLPIDVSPASKASINNVIHGGSAALKPGPNGAPMGHNTTFGAQPPNGQPPRTATGPNGQRIALVGGRWVPIR